MKGFETLLGLLLVSALLAALARKVRLPVPVVMVVGGVAAAFAPVVQDVSIDPDVAFTIFVPPLLFRAAITTSVRGIREHLRAVTLLAVGLVVATAVVVAAVAHWAIPGVGWPAAFVLGAVLSPPDATAETYRQLEQGILDARRHAAVSLRNERVIDDEVLRRLERELDLEELRITPEDEG